MFSRFVRAFFFVFLSSGAIFSAPLDLEGYLEGVSSDYRAFKTGGSVRFLRSFEQKTKSILEQVEPSLPDFNMSLSDFLDIYTSELLKRTEYLKADFLNAFQKALEDASLSDGVRAEMYYRLSKIEKDRAQYDASVGSAMRARTYNEKRKEKNLDIDYEYAKALIYSGNEEDGVKVLADLYKDPYVYRYPLLYEQVVLDLADYAERKDPLLAIPYYRIISNFLSLPKGKRAVANDHLINTGVMLTEYGEVSEYAQKNYDLTKEKSYLWIAQFFKYLDKGLSTSEREDFSGMEVDPRMGKIATLLEALQLHVQGKNKEAMDAAEKAKVFSTWEPAKKMLLYRMALETKPEESDAYYPDVLSSVLRFGRFTKAKELEDERKTNGRPPMQVFLSGYWDMTGNNRQKEGTLFYEKMVKMGEKYPHSVEDLSLVLSQLVEHKRYDLAVALLEKEIQEHERDPRYHKMLSYLYELQEDNQSALGEMIKARDISEDEATLFSLMELYKKNGDRENMKATYLRLNELTKGKNPDYPNYLAYSLAEEKEDLDYAEELVKQSLQIDPTSEYYLDTYAWIEYQRGHYDKAKEWMEKAISFMRGRRDNYGEIYDHASQIYGALGNEVSERNWRNMAKNTSFGKEMEKRESSQK